MIYTLRQLQDLHKTHGQVVLPYRARLTPLAADWIRAKKIPVGYSDNGAMKAPTSTPVGSALADGPSPLTSNLRPPTSPTQSSVLCPQHSPLPPIAADFLWWCDGPCGPAKAAILSQSRESSLAPLDTPADEKFLVHAIKRLAQSIKSGHAQGGVLLVSSGAPAVVYANHCPSLRAILGSNLLAVRTGIEQTAANVLIIEHPAQTTPQVKTLLHLFCRGPRTLTQDQHRLMQELATCA